MLTLCFQQLDHMPASCWEISYINVEPNFSFFFYLYIYILHSVISLYYVFIYSS